MRVSGCLSRYLDATSGILRVRQHHTSKCLRWTRGLVPPIATTSAGDVLHDLSASPVWHDVAPEAQSCCAAGRRKPQLLLQRTMSRRSNCAIEKDLCYLRPTRIRLFAFYLRKYTKWRLCSCMCPPFARGLCSRDAKLIHEQSRRLAQ